MLDHRRALRVLVCALALGGCGVAAQGEVPRTEPAPSIAKTSPTEPAPSSTATATPFPTIRADDIKLTPVSSFEPVATARPDAPFNQIVTVYRTSEITPSTNKASVIIVGVVQEVGSARWTTEDGQRPAAPHAPDRLHTIFRPVRVHVQTVLKGAYPEETISLYGLGGAVGPDSVTWLGDDLHTFSAGDTVMVFLGQYPTTPSLDGQVLWELADKFTLREGQAINSFQSLPFQELVRAVSELAGAQK